MAELSEQEKKKLLKEYLESMARARAIDLEGKMPTDPNQMRSYFGGGETNLATPTSSEALINEIAKSDKPNQRPSFEELIKMEGAPELLKKLSANMGGIYSPIFEQNNKAPTPNPTSTPTPTSAPQEPKKQRTPSLTELIMTGQATKDQQEVARLFPSLLNVGDKDEKIAASTKDIAKRLQGTSDPAKEVLSQREKIARIRSNFANKRQADFQTQQAKSRQFVDEILDDPRRWKMTGSTPSGEGRTINRMMTGDPSGRRDIRSAAAKNSEKGSRKFFEGRRRKRQERRNRPNQVASNSKPRYGFGSD
jgi:hypothetical protein